MKVEDIPRAVICVTCVLMLALMPANVWSATHAIDDTLCNIVRAMSGSTGKAFETLCIIILGVMMLTGKLTLKSSMLEIAGAGLVVGAGSIVVALGAGSGAICP